MELNDFETKLARMEQMLSALEAKAEERGVGAEGGAEFYRVIFNHYVHRQPLPESYQKRAITTGDTVGVIVPGETWGDIMSLDDSPSPLVRGARRVTMSAPVLNVPILNQAGVTSGNPYTAGVSVAIVGEGGPIGETEPAFTQAQLQTYTVAAVTELTIQAAQDAPVVSTLLPGLYRDALQGWIENMMLNGTGTGQPLGIVNSPALLEVNMSGASIAVDDLFKMYSAFKGRGGVWVVGNIATLASILKIKSSILQNFGTAMELMGYPIYHSQYLSDYPLMLVDPSQVLLGVYRDAQIDVNDGPGFTRATLYYRLLARLGVLPWLNGKIKLANGDYVSPFVALKTA